MQKNNLPNKSELNYPSAIKWMWNYCKYLGSFTDSNGCKFDLGIFIDKTGVSAAIVCGDNPGDYYSGELDYFGYNDSVHAEIYKETRKRASELGLYKMKENQKNSALRIEMVTDVLIERGTVNHESIYIKTTKFNDEQGTLELTDNCKDFSKLKPISYSISHGPFCMSKKTGQFDYEPMSSGRDDKFFKEYRFDSYDAAKETYLKFHGDRNYFQDSIDRMVKHVNKIKSNH